MVATNATEVVLIESALHPWEDVVLSVQSQPSGVFVQALAKVTGHEPVGAVPMTTAPALSVPEGVGDVPHPAPAEGVAPATIMWPTGLLTSR